MNRKFSLSVAILVIVSLFFSISFYGQNSVTASGPAQQTDNDFFKIQREFNEYWAPYNVDCPCSVIASYPYSETFDSWTTSSPTTCCTADGSVLLVNCWTNVVGDNIDWDIYSGSTGSSGTGPTSDHTGGGNYLYTEASGCFSNTGAITSPGFDLSGISTPELTFWYHMYGADMGTLSIQVSTNGGSSWSADIWSLSGDQGNSWHEQLISLDTYTSETSLIIRFTGTTGTGGLSDIAIDDFSITGIPVSPGNQITDLDGGWNIMSFYVTPASLDMIDIFQPLIDNSTLVKISDEAGGIVQYIPGSGWLNTIGNMSSTEGYYVNLTSSSSLTTDGTSVTYPFDIPMAAGWNIMGYPSDVSQSAMTVLQPLIDDGYLVKVIDETGGFIQYITGIGWMNTINTLDPGKGYLINVNADYTLSMSDPGKGSIPNALPEAPATKYFASLTGNPFRPMNVVIRDIETTGFQLEEGDEIAVFDGDLEVGSMVILSKGEDPRAIAVRSDDPLTQTHDGFLEGGELIFKYWDKSENILYTDVEATQLFGNTKFTSLGTYGTDLNIGSLGDGEYRLPGTTFLGQNFPNPYSDKTRINYGITEDAVVTISVHDVSGRTVMILQNCRMPAGKYYIEMNKASLEAGTYYYRMNVNGRNTNFSATRKMILF